MSKNPKPLERKKRRKGNGREKRRKMEGKEFESKPQRDGGAVGLHTVCGTDTPGFLVGNGGHAAVMRRSEFPHLRDRRGSRHFDTINNRKLMGRSRRFRDGNDLRKSIVNIKPIDGHTIAIGVPKLSRSLYLTSQWKPPDMSTMGSEWLRRT